jgi:hypothetical protein
MRSRLALLAVAALAGLALSACQPRDPSVAASVGSDKITESQVDAVLADAQQNRPVTAPSASPAPGEPSPGEPSASPLGPVAIDRADVVRYLVLDKMCTADQARRHFASQEGGQTQEVADSLQISPNSQFAKLVGHMSACLAGETANVAPVTPTDDEVSEVYDRAVAGGIQVPSKEELKADENVQHAIAIKRTLQDQAKVQGVSVNPRYRALEVTLLNGQKEVNGQAVAVPVVVATLGQPTDAIEPF